MQRKSKIPNQKNAITYLDYAYAGKTNGYTEILMRTTIFCFLRRKKKLRSEEARMSKEKRVKERAAWRELQIVIRNYRALGKINYLKIKTVSSTHRCSHLRL